MKVIRNGLLPEKERTYTWLGMEGLRNMLKWQSNWHRLIQEQGIQLVARDGTIT